MSEAKTRLRKILPELADDGSRELAAQYTDLVDGEREMKSLFNHNGFARILARLKTDFVTELASLVERTPDLKARKKVFEHMLGYTGAEKLVNQAIEEVFESKVE